MAEGQIEDLKAALRLRAHAQRAALSADRRAEASREAAYHFFEGVPLYPGHTVAAYWPIRDEIDCRPVLLRLMDRKYRVCLPVVEGDDLPLTLRLWEEGSPLYPSGFGTLAPVETAPLVDPDIVLIPLLGFDKAGTRLGYGKGHYDRTLGAMTTRPLLVGYAFAAQELPLVPREPHDIPLDLLVTELGVRRFPQSESTPTA